jgi:hypothetical protein
LGFDFQYDFFLEIINVAYALMLLVACKAIFKIEDTKFLILLGHFVLIFLTNYVLFRPGYLGDQGKYMFATLDMRGLVRYPFEGIGTTVKTAAYIFNYFPIPLVNSLYSLSIVDFLMYLFIYLFLRLKKIFTPAGEAFYFFFPSLALYSAVVVRDIMILVFMALFIYYFLVRQKRVLSFLLLIPLALLKPQNALVLIVLALVMTILDYRRLKLYQIAIMACMAAGVYIAFQKYFTLEYFNMLRYYFYFYENPDQIASYYPVNSWSGVASLAFFSFFRFILEPYPWQADSAFQGVQSLENIFVCALIIYLWFRYRHSGFKKERLALLLTLVFAMSLYGLVIINSGTAARYRFTFVVCHVVFYAYFGEKGRIRAAASDDPETEKVAIALRV